jgi:CRP-like cAMP-binding protein
MNNKLLSDEVEITPQSLPFRHAGDTGPLSAEELSCLRLFDGMDTADLELMAARTKIAHFAPGDRIVTQGDLADRFYVILSGKAAIECDLPDYRVQVMEIGPGEPVGFSWLFEPDKVHFSARALEPVTAVFFFGTLLLQDCEESPRLGYELAKRTGQTMLHRMEHLVAMVGGEMPSKKK